MEMIRIDVPEYLYIAIRNVWPNFKARNLKLMAKEHCPGAERWISFEITSAVYGVLCSQYEDHFHKGARRNKVYRIIQHNLNSWEITNGTENRTVQQPEADQPQIEGIAPLRPALLQLTYQECPIIPSIHPAQCVESSDGP